MKRQRLWLVIETLILRGNRNREGTAFWVGTTDIEPWRTVRYGSESRKAEPPVWAPVWCHAPHVAKYKGRRWIGCNNELYWVSCQCVCTRSFCRQPSRRSQGTGQRMGYGSFKSYTQTFRKNVYGECPYCGEEHSAQHTVKHKNVRGTRIAKNFGNFFFRKLFTLIWLLQV